MDDWVWALVGVAVTLSVTVAVILWYAFKHLDDKIERLGDRLDNKMDKKFDQVMAGITETKLLVAGHAERIEAQEKQQGDRQSGWAACRADRTRSGVRGRASSHMPVASWTAATTAAA